ncbi:MAG: 2Fe-2S iron-sulfur cluster-binding protein [Candidatus Binataceae bacterium]
MATIRNHIRKRRRGPSSSIPPRLLSQHDGRLDSILDVLLGHGIPLEHACGGNCACTTCHVIVKAGFKLLSEASEEEEDLLDKAPGLTPTSRLGCQAVIEDPDAEIIVIIPRYTINRTGVTSGRQPKEELA